MKIKKIEFDELDQKVLNEIPFFIELFTTTLKKLSNILENHFSIIENEIANFLEKNAEWKISSKNYFKNYHYPFFCSYDKRIIINNLEEYYRIDYYLYAFKGEEISKINGFEVWIGFEYSKDDVPKPNLFYELKRDNVEKLGGINISSNILNSFKSINKSIEISDPSKGGKVEEVNFYNYEIADINIIEEQFEIFRTKILIPYLKNIKWNK